MNPQQDQKTQSRSEEPLALPLLAIMARAGDAIDSALSEARARFGDILESSPDYDFDAFTKYYAPEFGEGLVKRVILFAAPREQRYLAEDKLWSNALEDTLARDAFCVGSQGRKRSVNIDPGYLTLSKLVLASTKDHAQRIYLGQAIWAEITLAYRGKSFTRHPWSYPDYAALIPFFNKVRQDMRARIEGDLIHRLR
jgi:hypothetical protein